MWLLVPSFTAGSQPHSLTNFSVQSFSHVLDKTCRESRWRQAWGLQMSVCAHILCTCACIQEMSCHSDIRLSEAREAALCQGQRAWTESKTLPGVGRKMGHSCFFMGNHGEGLPGKASWRRSSRAMEDDLGVIFLHGALGIVPEHFPPRKGMNGGV